MGSGSWLGYPPAVAGGLRATCHGLTTALADRGHEVVRTPRTARRSAQPYPRHRADPPGGGSASRPSIRARSWTPTAWTPRRRRARTSVSSAADLPRTSDRGSLRQRSRGARKALWAGLSAAIQRYSREAVAASQSTNSTSCSRPRLDDVPRGLRFAAGGRLPPCPFTVIDRGSGRLRVEGGVRQRGRARGSQDGSWGCAVSGTRGTSSSVSTGSTLAVAVHNAAPAGLHGGSAPGPGGPHGALRRPPHSPEGWGSSSGPRAVLESCPGARFVVMGEGRTALA